MSLWAEHRAGLSGGPGGGYDGPMPPDEIGQLKERMGRLEERVDNIVGAVEALSRKVDGVADKIDRMSEKVSGLAERVSAIEGQLRHIPTITTTILGQLLASVTVAGIILTAIYFGANAPRAAVPAAATTTSSPAK